MLNEHIIATTIVGIDHEAPTSEKKKKIERLFVG